MFKLWFEIPLWKRIVGAMIAGLIVGWVLPESAVYLQPIGKLFLNAIQMIIIPIVVATLIAGVTSVTDLRALGGMGMRAFGLYLITTSIAIVIGLTVGAALQPGSGLDLIATEDSVATSTSLAETLINIVPENPIAAMSNGEILPTIVFALLFGIGAVIVGNEAEPVIEFFRVISEIMFKLAIIVMELAPFGVFALIAAVIASIGLAAIIPLAVLVIAVYVACALHILVVYLVLVKYVAGIRPLEFLRAIRPAQLVAFATTSSSAALPITMACATNSLKVDRAVAGFVLPLGATINMDGTALYMGVAALFAAQAYGIVLEPSDYVVIVLTATLASIGTAGVPGAGLIMMSMVLSATAIPIEALAIIAGVDRLMDMARTMTNVTGDTVVSVMIRRFSTTAT